jgi:hypothetical protein
VFNALYMFIAAEDITQIDSLVHSLTPFHFLSFLLLLCRKGGWNEAGAWIHRGEIYYNLIELKRLGNRCGWRNGVTEP